MENSGGTVMSWLSDALANVWEVVGDAFSFMTGNAYFATLLAIGLTVAAFRVIKRAKKTAIK